MTEPNVSEDDAPPPDPREWDANRVLAEEREASRRLMEYVGTLEGLVAGLDRLLVCYRTGSHPSGALLDRIKEARRRVAAHSAQESGQ